MLKTEIKEEKKPRLLGVDITLDKPNLYSIKLENENYDSTEEIIEYIISIYDLQEKLEKTDNRDEKVTRKILEEINKNIDLILSCLKINKSLKLNDLITKIINNREEINKLLYKPDLKGQLILKIDEIINNIRYYYILEEKKFLYIDKNTNIEINGLQLKYIDFDVIKLDGLYRKLYEALLDNNKKRETLYRGRLIRALKENKEKIDESYNQIKDLIKIKNLLDLKPTNYENEIKKILELNKFNYKFYLIKYLYNISEFEKKFKIFYIKNKVNKICLYKDALKEELKQQRLNLKNRYSMEFLNKRETIVNFPILLGKSTALSILKLTNTINEIKEAKTNRRKFNKVLELFKDLGLVVTTPVINIGKFTISNWYVLYRLYKNFSSVEKQEEKGIKEDKAKETEKEVQKEEENKNTKVDRLTANKEMTNEQLEVKENEDSSVEEQPEEITDLVEEEITYPQPQPEITIEPKTTPQPKPQTVAEPDRNSNIGTDNSVSGGGTDIEVPSYSIPIIKYGTPINEHGGPLNTGVFSPLVWINYSPSKGFSLSKTNPYTNTNSNNTPPVDNSVNNNVNNYVDLKDLFNNDDRPKYSA